jgi:DNA-binding response OmpR family regulator
MGDRLGSRRVSGEVQMQRRADARILVVDDEPMLCRAFVRTLLMAGYPYAEGVETARAAMLHLAVYPADLVILDVTLRLGDSYPDGCALGRAIVDRWPGTRFLFLSGYHLEDLVAICPTDLPLLRKPVLPPVFLARVAEALMTDPYRWPEAR